ncbi:hypothetical protein [Sorangium sp. So ce542]|uniref:hypothetical protein n=1 Tax=Sorangium sp. So ce542 TaxID=3133316 RepID=UPI003F5EE95F
MNVAPRLFGMVVEGPGDARTVPGLVDRVVEGAVPVLKGKLGRARSFCGLDANAPFVMWSAVHQYPVPRRHGHFGGKPALEDARTAVLALRCFVARNPQPEAVVLVRDSDGKEAERRQGLEQARQDFAWPFEVLLGVAHPMRECWVLAGFVPENKREETSLAALRRELGFDPTARSNELDASSRTAKKSPKRVLDRLTGNDDVREARCWTEPALGHLRQRGNGNGLAAFLGEVEARLVPIFSDAYIADNAGAELGPPQPSIPESDETSAKVPSRS